MEELRPTPWGGAAERKGRHDSTVGAEAYAACFDLAEAQRARVLGGRGSAPRWGPERARSFQQDPRRPLDEALAEIAQYVEPHDVLVDVGGGAGRIALPLALRCRCVINVDPSAAMRDAFEASKPEAGITNAEFVQAAWLDADSIRGDVVLAVQVTYFVREIVPFIEKLERAARRRVLIYLWSATPAMQVAGVFRFVHGEEVRSPPGYRELLPVLWELGILPDVRVLSAKRLTAAGWPQPNRASAVLLALERIGATGDSQADQVDAHVDELFEHDAHGFWPRWPEEPRELLITWETRGRT